jgi:ABC-type hemin transport system substrate-binding protein
MVRNIFLAVFVLVGCTNVNEEQQNGERIVSLSPSITATLVDVGAEEYIVGRSAFCKSVREDIPVVGDLYNIDYERLLRLHPTNVFVQKTTAEVDAHLQELATRGNFSLHTWKCDRVFEIATMHKDLLEILAIEGETFEVKQPEILLELPVSLLLMTPGSASNAGLCFGKQTYLDDVLTLLGGTNALNSSGWITLTLEDIARLQPHAIVVVSDIHFEISKGLKSLNIPVIPFIHEDVLVPSSRIIDVAKALQQKLKKP